MQQIGVDIQQERHTEASRPTNCIRVVLFMRRLPNLPHHKFLCRQPLLLTVRSSCLQVSAMSNRSPAAIPLDGN